MTGLTNRYNTNSISSHSWTTRWTYTVPNEKSYNNGCFYGNVRTAIATGGQQVAVNVDVSTNAGVNWYGIWYVYHTSTTLVRVDETLTALFSLKETDAMRGRSYHTDTVTHGLTVASIGTEFDNR
jgi:hypothetical protein